MLILDSLMYVNNDDEMINRIKNRYLICVDELFGQSAFY